jgi:branched-chain amino acid transport system ATP-binding protein
MLKVRGLSAGYGALPVLHAVDLDVFKGEWLALLGPVGAGKTTMLAALAGLLPCEASALEFDGAPICKLAPHQRLRQGLALVPEGRRLFAGMTVRENLLAGTHALAGRVSRERNMELVLKLFPILGERQRQLAGTLSGGEQQMCAIGRALMGSPRLLMIDEVTLGLAPLVIGTLFETLSELRRQGVTLLTVEQNVPLALDYADRAYVMNGGRMVLQGNARELRDDPDLPRRFLGQ